MFRPSSVVSILVVAAGITLSPGQVAAADRPVVAGESGRQLDDCLSRLEKFGFSGGALAVRGKDVLLMKSYGLADRDRGVRMSTDSVFSLGSITKQFTAAAILTLEVAGKLSVNDPITRYLDQVPSDKAGITLHHLLTHSSGLESDFSPTDYEPVGREEYVQRALRSHLLFKPGEGYEYSNAGYSLLAAIVERVSGEGYEAYLAGHVLQPAGMMETGYKAPGWAPERIARGYRDGEDWGTILQRIQQAEAPYWQLRGNGGLHTTLADMLAWHRALDSDRVLPAAAREKYFKPYVAEGPAARSFYAYGWAVGKTSRGTRIVQHNGGNGIYVAEFMRFPDEDAMLFVTSTDAGLKATPVIELLERIMFGERYQLPPAVVDLPAARVASLGGEWKLPKGGSLVVEASGGGLSVKAEAPEAMAALYPFPPGAGGARVTALNARTGDISGRAFKGDVSGLAEAMGAGVTPERLREQEAGMMQDRERRLGKFKGSSVLGTIPGEEDTARTIVRLDFEKASVFNVYTWGPRRLLGIRGMPQIPPAHLLPVSEAEFVSLPLGGAPAARLRVARRDGDVVLLLGAPDAPIVARRAK